MGISKTLKEKTVIVFFALTLVTFIAMIVIDPHPPGEHEGHDHGDDPSVSLDEKIAQARSRLKASPGDVSEMIYLGDLLIDASRYREALTLFNDVIKIEPKNIHALTDLGTLYQRTGSYDKSYEKFMEVIELDPESIQAIYNLGMLNRYYKKDNDKALEYLERLLTKELDLAAIEAIKKEIATIKAETK